MTDTHSPAADVALVPVTDADLARRRSELRLDKFLAESLDELSRSKVKWLIMHGHVSLDDALLSDPSYIIRTSGTISVQLPQAEITDVLAVPMELDIVYEDEALLVINKAAGLTVHPAAGHTNDTLVNGLLAYCGDQLSAIGDVARPGIVHRLDKDTSGLMVVAKTDTAHRKLAAQLADRSLTRIYTALVWGVPSPVEDVVDAAIGRHPVHRKRMAVLDASKGRQAITHYKITEKIGGGDFSLVECRLKTGRTHQIRVHMEHIGHSLVGDPVYGGPHRGSRKALSPDVREAVQAFPRQALHARALSFIHPVSNAVIACEAPLPEDMAELMSALRGE